MILADVEIHRFGLQDALLELAEGLGIPIATTILGKSVVPESHPLFVGVYEGTMSREEVTRFVESADCLLMLGCWNGPTSTSASSPPTSTPPVASTPRAKTSASAATTIRTSGSTTS